MDTEQYYYMTTYWSCGYLYNILVTLQRRGVYTCMGNVVQMHHHHLLHNPGRCSGNASIWASQHESSNIHGSGSGEQWGRRTGEEANTKHKTCLKTFKRKHCKIPNNCGLKFSFKWINSGTREKCLWQHTDKNREEKWKLRSPLIREFMQHYFQSMV